MPLPDTESVQITTALLLAAGSGCRLRPLTDDQPKCLTDVDGVPILERLVRCLRQQGLNRLVVVVGHQEHQIREFLGRRRQGGDMVTQACQRFEQPVELSGFLEHVEPSKRGNHPSVKESSFLYEAAQTADISEPLFSVICRRC